MLVNTYKTGPTESTPLLLSQAGASSQAALGSPGVSGTQPGSLARAATAAKPAYEHDGVAEASASPPNPRLRRSRPRFWFLLPLVALVDVLIEGYVGIAFLVLVRNRTPGSAPGSGHHTKPKNSRPDQDFSMAIAILGVCLMRSATISVVGIGNKTDQLGLIVAGICAISALVLVAVLNLLFQSGTIRKHGFGQANAARLDTSLPQPSLTLLTSLGLIFTVIEYLLYILVVGIRVPPGEGPAISRMRQVRQWKRGVRDAQPQGDEEDHWITEVEGEEDFRRSLESPTREARSSHTIDVNSMRGNRSHGSTDALSVSPSPSPRLTPSSHVRPEDVAALSSQPASYGSTGSHRLASRQLSRKSSKLSSQTKARNDSSGSGGGQESHNLVSGDPEALNELRDDNDDDDNDDDDDGDNDPNEIMDIPMPSSTSRDASRFRLALSIADEPERRRSRTLSMLSAKRSPGAASRTVQLEDEPTEGFYEDEVPISQRYEIASGQLTKNPRGSGAPLLEPTRSSSSSQRSEASQQRLRSTAAADEVPISRTRKASKSRAQESAAVPAVSNKRRRGVQEDSTASESLAVPGSDSKSSAAMLATLSTSPLGTRGIATSSQGDRGPLRVPSAGEGAGRKLSSHLSGGGGGGDENGAGTSGQVAAAVRASGKKLRNAFLLRNDSTRSGLMSSGGGGKSAGSSRKLFGGGAGNSSNSNSNTQERGKRSQRLVDD